jgi:hypothetical protein
LKGAVRIRNPKKKLDNIQTRDIRCIHVAQGAKRAYNNSCAENASFAINVSQLSCNYSKMAATPQKSAYRKPKSTTVTENLLMINIGKLDQASRLQESIRYSKLIVSVRDDFSRRNDAC